MVKHIVMWKHGDNFTQEEKMEHAKIIKESLEALKDKVPGVISATVITEPLPSGSGDADLILDSSFESVEALNNYQIHPEHVKAATFVRSVVKDRKCIDYYE
ncbi:Dabb family protein [Anaerocolumna sp. AGMB13025]|uniref:Dabb family protein n=1 Tax=Anaerocolumna sp. AGMB13025 TaxID=3039116 RepID=UPI00241D6D34|nr:Dabb family protein [Anaerocolumna sp. AGMB13025]WFR56169.1 Dabb family protein [Anaerocolumna sp. AGMB13025]